jgi:hypothetical protein
VNPMLSFATSNRGIDKLSATVYMFLSFSSFSLIFFRISWMRKLISLGTLKTRAAYIYPMYYIKTVSSKNMDMRHILVNYKVL